MRAALTFGYNASGLVSEDQGLVKNRFPSLLNASIAA